MIAAGNKPRNTRGCTEIFRLSNLRAGWRVTDKSVNRLLAGKRRLKRREHQSGSAKVPCLRMSSKVLHHDLFNLPTQVIFVTPNIASNTPTVSTTPATYPLQRLSDVAPPAEQKRKRSLPVAKKRACCEETETGHDKLVARTSTFSGIGKASL
jgi:hypothetical protein